VATLAGRVELLWLWHRLRWLFSALDRVAKYGQSRLDPSSIIHHFDVPRHSFPPMFDIIPLIADRMAPSYMIPVHSSGIT
jgi:hypothetical protein